jgi:integrase
MHFPRLICHLGPDTRHAIDTLPTRYVATPGRNDVTATSAFDFGSAQPHVVQAIARHADVKVTLKVYAHANLDAMREALGRLDGRLL